MLLLVYVTKNFHLILNPSPIISLPAGCINQNEISPLPPYPWSVPDAIENYSSVLNGYPCNTVHFSIELFFMGSLCGEIGTWHDWSGNVCKNKKRRLTFFKCVCNCFIKSHGAKIQKFSPTGYIQLMETQGMYPHANTSDIPRGSIRA